jgi:regulatory protein
MNGVQAVDNDGNPIKEGGVAAAILHYCKYQERCHYEVRNKLYELGCRTAEVEERLSELIENGVLNEERFAKLYAGGKFRMMQWGREKIRQQLKLRRISDYCIRKGLAEIDGEDYEKTLQKLTNKKLLELKSERNQVVRKSKLYRYLVQKGFERDLVMQKIEETLKKQDR